MKKYFRYHFLRKMILISLSAGAASLAWNSQAEVIIKKFDPPFQTGDSVFAGENSVYSSLHILIDSTGTADFVIPYSFSKISFNSPAEIIVGKEELWDTRLIGGLAFGSIVGENIVESTNRGHVWSSVVRTGHDISFPATLIQSVVPLSLGAEPTSVDYVSEIRGREGIIGFKFQHEDPYGGYTMHYGYFHFDLSDSQEFMGEKGYLLGWAYETEADKPIVAEPLAIPPKKIQFSIQKLEDGGLELSWLATPGATYQAERSFHSEGPFEKVGEEIVPIPVSGAKPVQEKVIISKEEAQSSQTSFWRIVRLK
ncbi:MAG: hypothetical protein EOM12_09680 [Verrucomicrobiae bacterium]|nr:hypothetical protein [Verrucomicrobiae bacterium]